MASRRSRAGLDVSDLRELAQAARVSADELLADLRIAVSVASASALAGARLGMPVFTGEGANSIQQRGVAVQTLPGGIRVTDSVFSPTAQVAVMEEGRKPGAAFPPFGPIRRWVELKSRRGDLDLAWTGRKGDAAVDVAAVHIGLSISRKGIAPRGFMSKAALAAGPVLLAEVESVADKLRRRIE